MSRFHFFHTRPGARRGVALAMLALSVVAIGAGMSRRADARKPDKASPSGPALGNSVYTSLCSACHQPNGEGLKGAFPALKGDRVVLAKDPTEHVRVVLFGLNGQPIAGVHYTLMPPWAGQLTDVQVAAVVNHERTSWGNDAPTVTVQDVAAVRRQGPPADGATHR